MSKRAPSEHLDALIALVKSIHAVGVKLGMSETEIEALIGRTMIMTSQYPDRKET